MSYYHFYLVEYLGAPRNHHAIWVTTETNGDGSQFHVTGDIQRGMDFEARPISQDPRKSQSFVSRSLLGQIKAEDLALVESICRANPPPAKQSNGGAKNRQNQAFPTLPGVDKRED
ncbi:hypothetical protein PG994_001580 [Apiospora phragmitis]|uniref:Uncharacterized protein n=1 Tax=Apiospora phragmitis TaxID=2905665 RepID=A0ABR1WTX3_9PEZI